MNKNKVKNRKIATHLRNTKIVAIIVLYCLRIKEGVGVMNERLYKILEAKRGKKYV